MKKYLIMLLLLIIPLFVYAEPIDTNGSLTIENIQNNNEDIEYEYNIYIEGVRGATSIKIDGNTDYIVFNAQGKASFTAPSNSTIIFDTVPLNASYTVQVELNDKYDININNMGNNSYSGVVLEHTKVTIKTTKKEEPVVIDEPIVDEQPKEIKNNPKTSDSIAIIGLISLITLLIIYTLFKTKTSKYE